jgi:nucleoside-diphosphate-sugar epimerase
VVREAQRRGLHVRAGVRNVQRATARGLLADPPASIRVVPLDVVSSTDSTLQAALQGVQVVVCCVGFVPTYSAAYDRAQMWAVDAEGVSRLVEAAEAAADVRRFVLVSSLLVNAPTTSSYAMLNTLGGVLEAKAAAERRLRASSLPYTILRPGVFAPRAQGVVYLAAEDTFDGEHDPLLGPPVACASPFMAGTDRAVCGVTRAQVSG